MENVNPSDYLLTLDQDSYLPLSRYLPHQREVLLKDPHRFKVLVWHRKARKTYTAITEIVKQAHLRVGVYWHIFPRYGDAKDTVWRDPNMLFSVIPQKLIHHRNETDLVVYFNNGSIYQLKGSDDPDALRGPNPFGIVFDEFDTQKMEAWQVMEPIIRANGGWTWFIGTPKGKTNLFKFYLRGQEQNPEWKSWLLKASDSGIIAADQLEKSRQDLIALGQEDYYLQEYECAFNEATGAVFRNVRDIMTSKPHPPIKDHIYVMGVDLAKVKDFTVIRVYDRDNNSMVFKDRMQTLDWPTQRMKIAAVAKHYNNALTVVDATGVGDPIADELTRAGVAVVPFKITMISKQDIIQKLSSWIQLKKIRMLHDEDALFEYDNFTYQVGPLGQLRYGAREGTHDDIVMADALAVWHLNPVYMADLVKEPTPTQVEFMRAKLRYENSQLPMEEQADPLTDPEWGYVDPELDGTGW